MKNLSMDRRAFLAGSAGAAVVAVSLAGNAQAADGAITTISGWRKRRSEFFLPDVKMAPN
jgi:hypothetical protein